MPGGYGCFAGLHQEAEGLREVLMHCSCFKLLFLLCVTRDSLQLGAVYCLAPMHG